MTLVIESSLDPILPLPAGTGIPPIKEGRGKDLFENDLHVAAGMTYRAFYTLWEQAERLAAINYPRYVGKGKTWELVAQTALEAVVWCRQIGHPNIQIEAISEKKAQKIRRKEVEAAKAKAEADAAKRAKARKKADPQDVDVSVDDGASDVSSDPSTKPSKARKGTGGSKAPAKSAPPAEKSKEKGKKSKEKKKAKKK